MCFHTYRFVCMCLCSCVRITCNWTSCFNQLNSSCYLPVPCVHTLVPGWSLSLSLWTSHATRLPLLVMHSESLFYCLSWRYPCIFLSRSQALIQSSTVTTSCTPTTSLSRLKSSKFLFHFWTFKLVQSVNVPGLVEKRFGWVVLTRGRKTNG